MRILNFIKTFFRNILLHSGFSLLTLFGLSIGIAMSLLVLIYVYYESNYDRHWPHTEQIFRLYSYGEISGEAIKSAVTPQPLAGVVAQAEDVEAVVRLVPGARKLVAGSFNRSLESGFFYADPGFFEIFDLTFLEGDPHSALRDSAAVVLTRSTALRLFGEEKVKGALLTVEDSSVFMVSAVVDDVPANSHFSFDFLASWPEVEARLRKHPEDERAGMIDNWLHLNSYTYIKVNAHADVAKLGRALAERTSHEVEEQVAASFSGRGEEEGRIAIDFGLQPVSAVHLHSQLDNEPKDRASALYLYIFTAIAIFILLVTAVNFMNLTTAKAARRYKEVAVRKYFGAGRRMLILQFLTEAVAFSFLALFLALVLVEWLLPVFNAMFQIRMSVSGFIREPDTIWILVLTMSLGVLSGSYPALFFSGLKPWSALTGSMRVSRLGLVLRGLLISFQTALALVLLVLTLGMAWQLHYLQRTFHGFQEDHALVVEWGGTDAQGLLDLKEGLLQRSEVAKVGLAEFVPGDDPTVVSFRWEGDSTRVLLLALNYVDEGFFEALGAELVAGRWSRLSRDSSETAEVVVSASALRLLGQSGAQQQFLEMIGGRSSARDYRFKIVGVVADISFAGIKEEPRPMVFVLDREAARSEHLVIRLNNSPEGDAVVQEVWRELAPGRTMHYSSLAALKEGFYAEEQRFAHIAVMFALLALVLMVFGLIGMSAFLLQYHQKQLFIRKVLSAGFKDLLAYSLRDYWLFLAGGMALGLPAAAFVLQFWLAGFSRIFVLPFYAYILPVLLMLMLAFVVAWITGGREIRKVVDS